MCQLCSTEITEKTTAREAQRYIAARLRMLANMLDEVANGKIKPHSDDGVEVSRYALAVVKSLMEEWV
jgi:hypothetical protein